LPSIGEEEIQEVVECLRSLWLTTGPRVERFEREFAETVGARYALAVNSGTAALHLALEAIGVSEGHQVITTPFTFTATAEVVRYLGADPVFVDIDPLTLNIDHREIEAAVSEKTRAILPVHYGGRACAMDEIMTIAGRHGLKVVEDAAHALPCAYGGKMVGSIGDATAFSFYATKTLVTGEGGMLTTSSEEIANRVKIMRLHGINRDVWDRYSSDKPKWSYDIVAPGYKYNMPDIMAAIGVRQLKKLYRFQQRRNEIAARYDEAFQDLPLTTPQRGSDLHSLHLYVILLRLEALKLSRNEFIEHMSEAGVGTSVHFIPLHLMPYWRDRYGLKPDDFPVALDVYRRTVSLPIYPLMSDDDVERVISAVRRIMERFS